MAFLHQFFIAMAESHKTFQALICDSLFPCGDRVDSDAEEKLRTMGKGFVKICRVKKNVWEREEGTSARKMTRMVPG